MKTVVVKCLTDLGVHLDGADKGPSEIAKVLNNKNIVNEIEICKDKIIKSKDKSDLAKNLDSVNNFTKKHFDAVSSIINDKYFPFTIGGDHTVAIGSILASNSLNHDLGVIWIDAHGDYNNFETTETGNIHGFPLAAVSDYKCDKLTSFLDCEYVNPKKCVIVGVRSVDKLEKVNIVNSGVTMFTMDDIREYGIEKVMEKAFDIAGDRVHISYDLDVIDPLDAPGVTVFEKDGIYLSEAYQIVSILENNIDKILSMDLVEYNPLNDINFKTRDIAVNIINKIVDKKSK